MYHIVYRTTNLITGNYYVGKHSTDCLDKQYYGSGKYLKRALRKYGKENFQVDYIFFAFTEQYAYQIEEEIVNESLISDPLSYNLKLGGHGGNRGVERPYEVKMKISKKLIGRKLSKDRLEKMRLSYKRSEEHPYYGKPRNKETRVKISNTLNGKQRSEESRTKQSSTMMNEGNHFYGKKHSIESKEKQALANSKYIYTLESPDGVITETRNLKKYCEDYQINAGQIRTTGKAKNHKLIKRVKL